LGKERLYTARPEIDGASRCDSGANEIMADDAGRLNQVFAETAFLYGGNADYIETLYGRWADNPASVPAEWRAFFEG
jgi:hypothetical protein